MANENEVIRVPYSPEFIENQQDNKKLDAFVKRVNDKFLKITRIDLFAKSPLKRGQISIDPSKQSKEYQKFIEKRSLDILKGEKSYRKKYREAGGRLQDILYKYSNPKNKQKLDRERVEAKLETAKSNYLRDYATEQPTKKSLKEVIKLQKQLQKLDKGTKLTSFQKLFNTFKRVGFYRIARRVFQAIEQGLGQGIEQLVAFDENANKTMSSIKSSFDKVGASVALMAMPLIEIVEPILSSMSNSIVAFANNVSMASAYMKGLGEYTKINEEYMRDLQQEANSTLLSFDKFESLNAKSTPFETAKIDEEDIEKAKQYGDTIKRIQDIFAKLWEVLKNIGKIILDMFKKLEPYWDDIVDTLLFVIGVIADLIVGFTKIFVWLGKIIDTKDKLIALLGVITSIAAAVAFATGHWIKGSMILAGGIATMSAIEVSKYSEGGMPNKGSLFVAGEAGAEFVTTMPSGQTGVTNVAQFKQAMVEAIYECSDVFQSDDGDVVLKLDGAEIARSKRFKSELNRTNAGLHLI